MSIRRYVASGRSRPFAIPSVLIVALLAGIATGVVEGIASRWISLLLLFPLLIGAAAGGLAGVMVHKTHLRAPAIAMVLGFLGGAAGYATVHAVQYVQFRSQASEAMKGGDVDQALVAETGHAGFVGYMKLSAEQGVSIKRVGVGDPGLRVPGPWALGLWGLELLIAAIVAGVLARSRAKEPFCEACDTWFRTPTIFATGGDARARKRVIDALEHDDLTGAATAFLGPRGKQFNLALASSTCPRCGSEAYLALQRVSARRAAHTPTIRAWLLGNEELGRLNAAVRPTERR